MKHDYVLTYCTKDKSLLVETDGVPPHSPCTFSSEQLRSLFGEVPFPARTRAERIEWLEAELAEVKEPKLGDVFDFQGDPLLYNQKGWVSLEDFGTFTMDPPLSECRYLGTFKEVYGK